MFSTIVGQLAEGLKLVGRAHSTPSARKDYFKLKKNTYVSLARFLLIIAIIIISGSSVCFSAFPLYIFLLVEVRTRETYQLNVRVSRKINALLVLEKARTGKSMPEIVEDIFREYSSNRKK